MQILCTVYAKVESRSRGVSYLFSRGTVVVPDEYGIRGSRIPYFCPTNTVFVSHKYGISQRFNYHLVTRGHKFVLIGSHTGCIIMQFRCTCTLAPLPCPYIIIHTASRQRRSTTSTFGNSFGLKRNVPSGNFWFVRYEFTVISVVTFFVTVFTYTGS